MVRDADGKWGNPSSKHMSPAIEARCTQHMFWFARYAVANTNAYPTHSIRIARAGVGRAYAAGVAGFAGGTEGQHRLQNTMVQDQLQLNSV